MGRFTVPLSEDGSKPKAVLQHFFDGLGMLHRFRMTNGEVFYRSRHTSDGILRKAKKDGYVTTLMFGLNANTPLKDAQDPCSALLGAQVSRISEALLYLSMADNSVLTVLTLPYSNHFSSPPNTSLQTNST